MFIETHTDTIGDQRINLTFVKSTNIQAFPCGRRRSTEIGDTNTRIPFDPEARLNTEANNRNRSGLNGYTQTYLESFDEKVGQLKLSLAGYLFNITLDDILDDNNELIKSYKDINTFGKAIAESTSADKRIYANILIKNTKLFSGSPKTYYSEVLDSQASDSYDESALDLLISGATSDGADNYYFSGLSFSSKPLSTVIRDNKEETSTNEEDFKTRDKYIITAIDDNNSAYPQQTVVSLCILEYDSGVWKLHEQAKLPKIEHGKTEDSVVLGKVQASGVETPQVKSDTANIINLSASTANIEGGEHIRSNEFTQNGYPVPTIELVGSNDVGNTLYQLRITLGPKSDNIQTTDTIKS